MNQEAPRHNGRLPNRKRQKVATTLVLLIAHVPAVSRAAAQTGKLSHERQAKIENTISTFMASSKAPGISVAGVQDREFGWATRFGLADLENSVPPLSQKLDRLGSNSNPITAQGAIADWEDCKLGLCSPL